MRFTFVARGVYSSFHDHRSGSVRIGPPRRGCMRGIDNHSRADEYHGREAVKRSTEAAYEEFSTDVALAAEKTDADLRDPSLYINRELSMLDFFERVVRRGARRQQPAARARQVRRHPRLHPRRVLHGPRRRPAPAGRRRRHRGLGGRLHAAEAPAAGAGARLGPDEGGARLLQRAAPGARRRRHPHGRLRHAGRRPEERPSTRTSRSRSSRCSRRSPSIPGGPSRTSPT